jgi:hypothetical protein
MQFAAIAILVAAAMAVAVHPQRANADAAAEPAVAGVEPVDPNATFPPKPSEPEPRYRRFASMDEICDTLEVAATRHALPVPFFARLIWQESRFRAEAVSRAGARGIAQFMPSTAMARGLVDPHDPILSLHASADFLSDLRDQFGNLGLAAAAYNGGPGRVQAWLKGRKGLPAETRTYVRIVTGIPADKWRRRDGTAVQALRIPALVPCPELVATAAAQAPLTVVHPARKVAAEAGRVAARPHSSGWAVLLAGSFSSDKAQQRSAMLQRKFRSVLSGRTLSVVKSRVAGRGKALMSQVRIAESDRARAEKLCARLRAGGASCVVTRAS